MAPPLFDDDSGFFERVEDLAIEEFVPEPGVEAFAINAVGMSAGAVAVRVGIGANRLTAVGRFV